jgi:hypothetical protein
MAVRTTSGTRKLFQNVPSKSDGSLYISFPYYKGSGGQKGNVEAEPNADYSDGLIVGGEFSVSTHYVKYSHYPSGVTQFSLTGKELWVIGGTFGARSISQ